MTGPAAAPPRPPERVTLVLGSSAGGTGAHVRMLAAGLADRGITVTVAGPAAAGARFGFPAVGGVSFVPVEIGDRPRAGDLAAATSLRRLLSGGPGHVVHAHGMRAGALAALARPGGRRRPALVVTVHNAPPGDGPAAAVYRLLERIVARRADHVLCVSADLEQRMRAAGARRVGRAVIGAPGPPGQLGRLPDGWPAGRPAVLAAGRLAAQKEFGTLIDAAVRWRDLEPRPALVIAGEGPLAGPLRAQAAARDVDAVFLGQVGDLTALLAAAAVFVLPSRWEGQPLVIQEALRAARPIVATRVGGVPSLTGQDAALLVPPGDPVALADAVRAVLGDAALAARLSAAAGRRAAALPTRGDVVAAALAGYPAPGPGLR